jgi:hypothetical protein
MAPDADLSAIPMMMNGTPTSKNTAPTATGVKIGRHAGSRCCLNAVSVLHH